MKQIIKSILYIVSVLWIAGCSNEETVTGNIPPNGILIEVEVPRTDGWNTEENIGTRTEATKVIKHKGKDGLDMEINIQSDFTGTTTGNTTTRWTNLDDNIIFRVVAYESATISGISTSNYVGYGDYKLSGNTIQTIKSLIVPMGTYTFVCYSYGNSNTIPTFTNSSTSVSAVNGQNFMTYIKSNVTINNLGSKYTLNNIAFKHQCVRYRVQAIAQNGRMGKITACSGTVNLPYNKAIYNFNKDACTLQAAAESVNVTWNNPNAMNVYSNYIYLLPQPNSMLTVSLSLTIGGKVFTNKSVTVSGPLTLSRNYMYCSNVLFTTTQGYIIRGAFWANGNLYYDGSFKIYGGMYDFSTVKGHDFWRWGALYPTSAYVSTSPWAQDPCQQVSPINSWRLPTITEYTSLLNGYSGYITENGKSGAKFDNILFFPATGYYHPDGNYSKPQRGLYWSSTGRRMLDFMIDNTYTPIINGSNHQDNYMTIRCVRAD